jgi:DNA-binding response OmpR family regulator/DNA-binding CsgD family transcriptional regulator
MIMSAPSQAETVLLVDDTPSSLGMLSDALEEAGFTVLLAQSGRKAIEIAARVIPNAILMDAIMPELDGFETSKRLKALEDLRDVPVLFMTGLSETEHIVMGLEAGGVDYVTKPVNPDELIARLRVHISNARNSRSAHVALDASGRHLMSVDLSGAVCWATPQASALLGTGTAEDAAASGQLPETAVDWLRLYLLPKGKAAQKEEELIARVKGRELRFTYAGNISAGEHLLRVSDVSDSVPSEILKDAFDLTGREAEVLIWIANGKSNKEIASILDMSPRTVNKHLDRIFGKMGVENRTSAAVVSLRRILES